MPADRVPFTPDPEPELAPQVREVSRNDGMSWLDHSGYHRMSDFLGIGDAERRAPKVAEQVAYLTDWGMAVTQSNDPTRIMQAINDLKRSLGTTYKGTELTTLLYRYARLDEQRRAVEGEMSLYQDKPVKPQRAVKKSAPKPQNSVQTNIDKQLKGVSAVVEKKVNETINAQISKTLQGVMKQFSR